MSGQSSMCFMIKTFFFVGRVKLKICFRISLELKCCVKLRHLDLKAAGLISPKGLGVPSLVRSCINIV